MYTSPTLLHVPPAFGVPFNAANNSALVGVVPWQTVNVPLAPAFGCGLILTVLVLVIKEVQPGRVKANSTPSTHTVPPVLVIVTILVGDVVIIVIRCKTSFGPALNIDEAPPEATVTCPEVVSRAKLIDIEVPIGTIWGNVIVRIGVELLT